MNQGQQTLKQQRLELSQQLPVPHRDAAGRDTVLEKERDRNHKEKLFYCTQSNDYVLQRCSVRNLPAPELGFLDIGGTYQGRTEEAGQTSCTRFLKNTLHANNTTMQNKPQIF